MAPIVVHIPATPVAQPRPRATAIGGYARLYSADRKHPVNAWRRAVVDAFATASKGREESLPASGPLAVRLELVFPRPASMTRKTRANPRAPYNRKPDCDNLAKSVMDALNGIAWEDDRQLCELTVTKWYAAGGEEPHAILTIREVSQ